jgi:RNA-directed DNA polymerase
VDHLLVKGLWRWAKRRHPTQPRRWIRARYFTTLAGRQWVFYAPTTKTTGKPGKKWLFQAASVPIERHTKTKGAANPYDPTWEGYFEQRLGVKMAANLRGRRSLLYLWKEQNGICPVCDQPITELTGWHSHHIMWRTYGGPDTAANRVLLHPECHRQVHSQGGEVGKPRPATGV